MTQYCIIQDDLASKNGTIFCLKFGGRFGSKDTTMTMRGLHMLSLAILIICIH